MPSPIAHSALLLLAKSTLARCRRTDWSPGQQRILLTAVLVALLAPDIDFAFRALPGLRSPIFEHGGCLHSLFAGCVFAVFFTAVLRGLLRMPLWLPALLLIGGACYESHVLMDACTRGRGVMVLWPFSSSRFALEYPLFYGFHHSRLGAWHLHLITISTELLFAAGIWIVSRRVMPRMHVADRSAFTRKFEGAQSLRT